MVSILPRLWCLTCLLVLALAVPASADVRTETFRTGPVQVGGYEVKQENAAFGVPAPDVDGFVTRMEVEAFRSAMNSDQSIAPNEVHLYFGELTILDFVDAWSA